jgi:hypothetical protein
MFDLLFPSPNWAWHSGWGTDLESGPVPMLGQHSQQGPAELNESSCCAGKYQVINLLGKKS